MFSEKQGDFVEKHIFKDLKGHIIFCQQQKHEDYLETQRNIQCSTKRSWIK